MPAAELATATKDGFWGPRTASVDWCEPNYTVTPYIAEFWNTVSSLQIVMAGLAGLIIGIRHGYRKRHLIGPVFLACAGVGSIAFHGTLKFAGQALDELSLVYSVSCYLFAVLEMHGKVQRPWLPYALVVFNLFFTAAYIAVPAYFTFFLAVFIGIVVVIFGKSAMLFRAETDRAAKITYIVGFFMISIAFFGMWIPDNLACGTVGWMHLHAWFHMTIALVPTWSGLLVVYRYYENMRLRAQASATAKATPASGRQQQTAGENTAQTVPKADEELGEMFPVPRIRLADSFWSTVFPHVVLTWKRQSERR